MRLDPVRRCANGSRVTIVRDYHMIRNNNFYLSNRSAIPASAVRPQSKQSESPGRSEPGVPMSGPIADQPELQRIIEDLRHLPGALLPILHAVQERFGFIDGAAVPIIAEALNLSRAEVHGVLTF